jgi:hypothetical protein
MVREILVLKIYQKYQSFFLIKQRKKEFVTNIPYKLQLSVDLYQRRNYQRRLSVNYNDLQIVVADCFYNPFSLRRLEVAKSLDNPKWLKALHDASDAIADCIDSGYLKCADTECNLLKMTNLGSKQCSFYYVAKKFFADFGIQAKVNI